MKGLPVAGRLLTARVQLVVWAAVIHVAAAVSCARPDWHDIR